MYNLLSLFFYRRLDFTNRQGVHFRSIHAIMVPLLYPH